MKTTESPLDLDSLLSTPTEAASDQSMPFLGSPVIQTPPQVNENHWDNEEILDIPRASAPAASSQESPLAIEDLLSAPPLQEEPLNLSPPSYESSVAAQNLPPETANINVLTHKEEEDSILEEDTPFAVETPSEFSSELSDEVLAEVPAQELSPPMPAPRPSVFAQDSYVRGASNTYVMATPERSNKGRLAKVFLAAALAFALLGVGYFALSGLVKDWLGLRKQQTAAGQPPQATSSAAINGGKPSVAPSSEAATASNTDNKNAVPGTAAATASVPTGPTNAKPIASPAATNQNALNKPTPTSAQAAQTGTSGHATASGEGSLAIQVASYKSAGEAQQTVSRLKSAGVEARVVKADVPGKGTWFRVQTGRFTSEAEAAKYAGELRTKGVTRDFIVTGYQNQ